MRKFKQILYEQEQPTEAQIKAGNYKKRKLSWNGLTISIENDAGSFREGTDSDGNTWKTKMYYDYGYINKTMAKDGDQIDIFIGPNDKSELIFVINQIEQKTGKFDEYKVMCGFNTKEDAIKGYLKNYEKGWKIGEVIGMSLDRFKEWIKEGDHNKPAKLSESIFFKKDLETIINKKYKRTKFGKILEEVKASKRKGLKHLTSLNPLDFIQLLNFFKSDLKGILSGENSKITLKIDGVGIRFGVDENGQFFMESSHSGPQFEKGSYAKQLMKKFGNLRPEMDAFLTGFDDSLEKLKANKKLVKYLSKFGGVKLFGEMLYIPAAKIKGNFARWVFVDYDRSKLGTLNTFILFKVTDLEGNLHPQSDEIIKYLKNVISTKEIKFDDPNEKLDEIDISYEIDNFLNVINSYKDIEKILVSRKHADRPQKAIFKALIMQMQEELSAKIHKKMKSSKFGEDFEGFVFELANGQVFKIISDKWKKRKKEQMLKDNGK